jgi:GNAT superfamily N-acetyltransferase
MVCLKEASMVTIERIFDAEEIFELYKLFFEPYICNNDSYWNSYGDIEYVYSATEDGRLVGAISISRCLSLDCKYQIEAVSVYPRHRRRGIAEKLIERALVTIDEYENVLCEAWNTSGDNARLHTPLTACGFERLCKIDGYCKRTGFCDQGCAEFDRCGRLRYCGTDLYVRFGVR